MIDRTMALDNSVLIKTGLLKMPVDIACENEITVWLDVGPFSQNVEAMMWRGGRIELITMSVEAPCTEWVREEVARIGRVGK